MKTLLQILFFLPAMVRAQSIRITASATTICSGTTVHFSGIVTGEPVPHYHWKINGINAGPDSSEFTTNTLSNSDTIKCLLTNSAGDTIFASSNIIVDTVESMPIYSPILGPYAVCVGTSITLTNLNPAGVWSASNGSATVSDGIITGVLPGPENSPSIDTIWYTVTNICSSIVIKKEIEVDPTPDAAFYLGNALYVTEATICVGSSLAINGTDGVPGGIFHSANGDTYSDGIYVYGVRAGTDHIYDIVTNGCGSDSFGYTIFVVAHPSQPPPIVFPSSNICVGESVTYADSDLSGIWRVRTGNTIINTAGILTALNPGLDTISFILENQCGTASANTTVNILPPGKIFGSDSVCEGTAVTLNSITSGGIWATSDPSIMTIDEAGNADGISTGSAIITYSYGSCSVYRQMTVNALPEPIKGNNSLCFGNTTNLTDNTPFGKWICANSTVATIDSFGKVFGVDIGSTLISYTTKLGCVASIEINITPPFPIKYKGPICVDRSMALSDSATAGSWSNTNPQVTKVESATGIVTGISSGLDTIMYKMPDGCNITTVVTVNPSPAAITHEYDICVGSQITLADTQKGTWSTQDSAVAIADNYYDIVNGLGEGVTKIFYTLNSGCYDSGFVRVVDCSREIAIFPNPFYNEVIIEIDTIVYNHCAFFNLLGQRLIDQAITESLTIINTQLLPPGIYFLSVAGDNTSRYVKKLVKE